MLVSMVPIVLWSRLRFLVGCFSNCAELIRGCRDARVGATPHPTPRVYACDMPSHRSCRKVASTRPQAYSPQPDFEIE